MMRNLLLLALILYDIICGSVGGNSYDYNDPEGNSRHSYMNDRRNWRKKALLKSLDHDNQKFADSGAKLFGVVDRQRHMDNPSGGYHGKGEGHYEDEKGNTASRKRYSEIGHTAYMDKEDDRKSHFTMNCGRMHERYEPCFAGCAAVSCDNPRERLRPCYPFCEAGCICVHPYVRDDRTHKCVLPEECTKGLKGIPDLGEDT